MAIESDLNKLWQNPSPDGSDKISTIIFKDPRDLIMRVGEREVRYGPLRAVIINNTRARYVFIFESEQGARNNLAVPTKGVDELLFWPRGQKAG